MLTGVKDLQALLQLQEEEGLNLKASFRDIVADLFTVCISQRRSKGPKILADSDGNLTVGSVCDVTHLVQAPQVTVSIQFYYNDSYADILQRYLQRESVEWTRHQYLWKIIQSLLNGQF